MKSSFTIDLSEFKAFIFVFLSIAVLIEPNYFAQYKGSESIVVIDMVYDTLKVVFSIIVLLLYLLCINHIRTAEMIVLGFMQLSLLCSTFLSHGSVIDWFRDFRTVAIVALLVNMMICLGYSLQVAKAISLLFGIYGYTSLITFLIFPKGLYTHELGYKNCWFLGYKNIAVPILLAGIIFSVYYSVVTYKKLSIFAASVIITSETYIFLVLSVTGIIVSLICIILLIINYRIPNLISSISSKQFLMVNIFGFPLLVIFRVQDRISILSSFVEGFGKTLTFSGRTGLWDYAIDILRDNWLTGIGVRDGRYYALNSGRWWAVHLHSYYLQQLVEGGIVAFIFLFLLLFFATKKFDDFANDKASAVFKVGFLCFLISFQFETYGQVAVFYLILIFMANIDLVEKDVMSAYRFYDEKEIEVR